MSSPENVEKLFKDKMSKLKMMKPSVFESVKVYTETEMKVFVDKLKLKVVDKVGANTITVNIIEKNLAESPNLNKAIKVKYVESIQTLGNKANDLDKLVNSFIKVKKEEVLVSLKDKIVKESEKSMNNIFKNLNKNMMK